MLLRTESEAVFGIVIVESMGSVTRKVDKLQTHQHPVFCNQRSLLTRKTPKWEIGGMA
jgi:hypothetical protein